MFEKYLLHFPVSKSVRYFSTNFNPNSTISLQKNKFYKQHNEIIDQIKDNKQFFIGFTESKDQSKESNEIEISKLQSPEVVKEFMNFFIGNSEAFRNIIFSKLKKEGAELDENQIYKSYLTHSEDKVAGVYPVIIDKNKIAGFGALMYYGGMKGRLNLSMYLFDDYQGKKIGSQVELFLCLQALENKRHIQGATSLENKKAANAWHKVCKELKELGYKEQNSITHSDFKETIIKPEKNINSLEYINNMYNKNHICNLDDTKKENNELKF
jgi:hypothetical protein